MFFLHRYSALSHFALYSYTRTKKLLLLYNNNVPAMDKNLEFFMKLDYKRTLLSTLILTSLTLPQWANASCSDLLRKEYVHRVIDADNRPGTLIGATIGIVLPAIVFLGPLGVAAGGLIYGLQGYREIGVRDAKTKYLIYKEAQLGGGVRIEKLYKKLQRKFPNSDLTIEEFIEGIRNADINEIGCFAEKNSQ
jgi:hypothetical protein